MEKLVSTEKNSQLLPLLLKEELRVAVTTTVPLLPLVSLLPLATATLTSTLLGSLLNLEVVRVFEKCDVQLRCFSISSRLLNFRSGFSGFFRGKGFGRSSLLLLSFEPLRPLWPLDLGAVGELRAGTLLLKLLNMSFRGGDGEREPLLDLVSWVSLLAELLLDLKII